MGKRGLPIEPIRPGARGGRDQFNWEDVKSMQLKERECYLGARWDHLQTPAFEHVATVLGITIVSQGIEVAALRRYRVSAV